VTKNKTKKAAAEFNIPVHRAGQFWWAHEALRAAYIERDGTGLYGYDQTIVNREMEKLAALDAASLRRTVFKRCRQIMEGK
jgi:hypothetical protein